MNNCTDCGIKISNKAKRCRKCAANAPGARPFKHPFYICPQCGREFYAKGRKTKDGLVFCCRSCRVEYIDSRKPRIKCPICGDEIVIKNHTDRITERTTCSYKCAAVMRRKAFPDKFMEKRMYSCKQCDDKFYRWPSTVKDENFVFCSVKCRNEYWRGSNVCTYTSISCVCEMCGTEFVRTKSKVEKFGGKYCSRECSSASQVIPGTSEYRGPNWNKQKRKARHRDGYMCQVCGKSEVENGRALCVHHIVPFREFDVQDYIVANSLENLISLCVACHRRVETKKVNLPSSDS